MSESPIEESQVSLWDVLAMPVSLVLTVGALGLGLLIGIETGGGEAVPTSPVTTEPAGSAEAGEQVFASAGCASCHTLSAAGATGTVGPNLDETLLSATEIVAVVTNGRGTGMPPFSAQLSEAEIEDVASYVESSASGTR